MIRRDQLRADQPRPNNAISIPTSLARLPGSPTFFPRFDGHRSSGVSLRQDYHPHLWHQGLFLSSVIVILYAAQAPTPHNHPHPLNLVMGSRPD